MCNISALKCLTKGRLLMCIELNFQIMFNTEKSLIPHSPLLVSINILGKHLMCPTDVQFLGGKKL